MPYEYEHYRIQAGGPDEPGIDGGRGGIADSPVCDGRPLTQLTTQVDELDETLASAGAES